MLKVHLYVGPFNYLCGTFTFIGYARGPFASVWLYYTYTPS